MNWGRVLARQSARPPPHRPSRRQRSPGYEDTHMGTRRGHHSVAPPEDGAARLAVAHFKTGWPVYDDALSRLGDTREPLLLMLPTDLAAALRQELDSRDGLEVEWEATYWPSSTGTPQTSASGICWRPTSPGTKCIWQPARRGTTSSPPFDDHGILPNDTWWEVQRKTLGRDYRRRVRARLLEIRDPLRQRWDDLWLCHLGPWSPPSHLAHTCHLCGE